MALLLISLKSVPLLLLYTIDFCNVTLLQRTIRLQIPLARDGNSGF